MQYIDKQHRNMQCTNMQYINMLFNIQHRNMQFNMLYTTRIQYTSSTETCSAQSCSTQRCNSKCSNQTCSATCSNQTCRWPALQGARMRCTAASIAQQQLGPLTIHFYAARQLAQGAASCCTCDDLCTSAYLCKVLLVAPARVECLAKRLQLTHSVAA